MGSSDKSGYIEGFLKKADKALQEGVKKADEVLEEAVEFGAMTAKQASKASKEIRKQAKKEKEELQKKIEMLCRARTCHFFLCTQKHHPYRPHHP